MLLTRVCSLWRSVALSPRIWTRLHIPLPGDPKYPPPYGSNVDRALEPRRQMFSKTMQLRCQAVKEWLDRSGSCPLSLSISYPLGHSPISTNYGAERDEVVDPLLLTIQPFAPRCRHLHLLMPFHLYEKLETQIPLQSLSMLRSFQGNILSHLVTPPNTRANPNPTSHCRTSNARGVVDRLSAIHDEPPPPPKPLGSSHPYLFQIPGYRHRFIRNAQTVPQPYHPRRQYTDTLDQIG